MKKYKIIFWITTGLLFLFEGLMPAITVNSEIAKEGIRHLGYPVYFGNTLAVFKVLGAICLIVPQVPKLLKEFAYAGFAFDFLFATISHLTVDGFNFQSLFPLIVLVILMISYLSFHKLNDLTNNVAV